MTALPVTRVVLYKHGVGYFEREGMVDGDATLSLTFKQGEVSDVLKSLTVLDLHGGHVSSVSYDSTKPLEQLLAEVAIQIPDKGSVVGLLPQIKGARVALHTGVSDPVEGALLGVDSTERQTGDGVVKVVLVSVMTDTGSVRSFDLHALASLQVLDDSLRRDLDFYLRTRLSATRKDARTFTFFAEGQGSRKVRVSYTLGAPVWKATYRILLGDDEQPALIQGWAVVDNTQDEDWEDVQLSLVSGLPVSFVHDLYTPRYIRRPEVVVKDTTGVLPPEVEMGVPMAAYGGAAAAPAMAPAAEMRYEAPAEASRMMRKAKSAVSPESMKSSTPTQVREQVLGDLLEYRIEHPVTIRRNQSALVPIVQKDFDGKPVLLYNQSARKENPMSAVLLRNTTGLTLEGGPVTVLQEGSYVGEAMLETIKPDEERIVPYAVELTVHVLDNIDSREDRVSRVAVKDGVLTTYRQQVQTTKYTLHNKGERGYTAYLDHPRPPGWELFDTAAPHETTENFWRFRFQLPPKQATAFVVNQSQLVSRRQALQNLDTGLLAFWTEQRYLDGRTEGVLRQVVDRRREEAELRERVQKLAEEKGDIHAAQARIRENLNALGDRSSEKDLRERYVRTLNGHEDRLEEIDRELKARHESIQKCQAEIKGLLDKLEYDATIG